MVELEDIRKLNKQLVDASPIYSFLLSTVEIVEVADGSVAAALKLQPEHMNSKNVLHGSVTATLIDWIGGLAIATSSLAPRGADGQAKRGVSVDIHATYVSAAREGERLLIVGVATKVGKSLAFVHVTLGTVDQGSVVQKVVAKGSHTKYL